MNTPIKYQEYKITIKRDRDGLWWITGAWNIAEHGKPFNWDLDGKSLSFKTRKEALNYCLTMTGIPE